MLLKENTLYKRLKKFSLDIYKLKQELNSKKEYTFADQLFRAGTSIGANYTAQIICFL